MRLTCSTAGTDACAPRYALLLDFPVSRPPCSLALAPSSYCIHYSITMGKPTVLFHGWRERMRYARTTPTAHRMPA